jgi:hypothetical protein
MGKGSIGDKTFQDKTYRPQKLIGHKLCRLENVIVVQCIKYFNLNVQLLLKGLYHKTKIGFAQ